MDTQSTLSLAAEIGMGVAGFSSIAAAILSRSIPSDLEMYWVQLRTLLQTSFAVTLLAYLPMIPGATDMAVGPMWRVLSAVYAAWVVVVIATGLRGFIRLMAAKGVTSIVAYVTLVLAFTSLGLNVANTALLGRSWPYLGALACGIFVSFMLFGLLLRGLWHGRKSEPTEAL